MLATARCLMCNTAQFFLGKVKYFKIATTLLAQKLLSLISLIAQIVEVLPAMFYNIRLLLQHIYFAIMLPTPTTTSVVIPHLAVAVLQGFSKRHSTILIFECIQIRSTKQKIICISAIYYRSIKVDFLK